MDSSPLFGLVRRLLWAGAAILATTLAYYLRRGYRVRRMFRSLEKQGIPLIKHSAVFGHLAVIGGLLAKLPSDARGDYIPRLLQAHWRDLFPACSRCPPLVYLDMWPFAQPMAFSMSAAVSAQFTQDRSLPKPPEQKRCVKSLSDNRDLSSMEGAEHKLWRRRFNPGFSPQNIASRVPEILEDALEFVRVLRTVRAGPGRREWGDVFPLAPMTVALASAISWRVLLTKPTEEQQPGKELRLIRPMIDNFDASYIYIHIGNVIQSLNPLRHLRIWANSRATAQNITPIFRTRAAELAANPHLATNKKLVDLMVTAVQGELGEARETKRSGGVDGAEDHDASASQDVASLLASSDFTATAVGMFALFVLAATETTSVTLCWIFRELHRHPDALARMRVEHDAVLGADPAQAAARVRDNASLLNALPYTAAFIKEVMRFHPVIGTLRMGEPGFFLTAPSVAVVASTPPPQQPGETTAGEMPTMQQFPTAGFVLFDGVRAIQRDPHTWHRADEFLPERFLVVDERDPLHPPRNGWRFFSMGPRNCIGQDLAMVEIKITLALVVREFDVECAYDELDRKLGRGRGTAVPMVEGDRVYHVGNSGLPKLKDGMPVRVRLR